MNIEQTEAAIEAILFAMGESVEAEKIAAAIEHDVDTTIKIVHNMMDKYEASDRGIRIIELENSFQLCTKTEYYDYLIKVCSQPRKYTLTDALLETLSIIAYKQPVTKLEIEKIRGVNSDHAVNKLVEYNLVTDVGRLDAPGRPMLFGTTEDFLRSFGVQSIDDLPVISEDMVEQYKEEAELEIANEKFEESMDSDDNQLTLGI
ncbi:MAG: SMC-Scp complex subunit ScpB [Lachnospira sp.]|nr:SMC-Scp complex subunit ScpB [Lachnospira sp.]MDD5827735.1 SMC-Scp complex subunit ScpB [Lachnospira sp.]